MQTSRFGRKLKLPATIAIKHQIHQLMFEDSIKADAGEKAEAVPALSDEQPLLRSL
jgi:hypothetical protein